MQVPGFRAAAAAAGVRYKNRLDLGLIVADGPATAAGVYTRNRVQAAPVIWSRQRTAGGKARAILVNSGNANACTGDAGREAVRRSAQAVAASLSIDPSEVLLASTGVIGEPLNIGAIEAALPALVASLTPDGLEQTARAMMTTDTVPKIRQAGGTIQGHAFTVVGMAKGSGMIQPNMATMLAFLVTDAAVAPDYLQEALARIAEETFNRITVDGDTSTNDCAMFLANGASGNPVLENASSPGAEAFENAMREVMGELARMLAEDGEGASRLVQIVLKGAVDNGQAKLAAFTVANSPLVKTAIFGQDANWGRLMMALGRSGAEFDPEAVDIDFDDAPMVRAGQAAGDPAAADEVMKKKSYAIHIDLHAGPGEAKIWTCDFSYDYVKINADYRS